MTTWVPMRKPYEWMIMPEGTDIEGPAAYRFGDVLYVGGCHNIRERLGQHQRATVLSIVRSGAIYPCETVEAALQLEKALIWLLNPSENQKRPEPTGPLWAATLGMVRPIHGWSWTPRCGHVHLDGRTLADYRDITLADCSCLPWDGWLDKAKRYVERVEAQIADAEADRKDLLWDVQVERWELEREREALAVCEGCEERDATIEKLESMLEQAQEAEWMP